VDDAEAIRRVRAGDAEAFGALVARYGDRLLRVLRGFVRNEEDARDLAQEAFLKAFSRLDRFDGRSSFYTWLYRIAANGALDHRKKHRRRPPPLSLDAGRRDEEGDGGPGPEPAARGDAPSAGAVRAEWRLRIAEAVDSLPAGFREVIVLREVEGLPYDAIAATLGLSRGTVESRLFRARERLRRRLGPLEKELE
jgi:RNA polymerase sigma-70 factor (ECF subfamily)